MRALLLEAITEADIRTWPNPDPGTLPAAKREGYLKRRAALTAVVGGMSIRAAAKAYGVGRDALAESAEKALQPGADGRLLGFRACVPYAHRKQPRDEGAPAPPPAKKGPGALTRLISATDGLATLVEGYAGPLPNGKRKCRRFDSLHRSFKEAVKTAHGATGYSFDVPDKGRRALRDHIKRLRQQRKTAARPETEDVAPPSRGLKRLFQEGPLDRIEYDAHTVDAKLHVALPAPDGTFVLRRLQQVTLLVAICAVTRYVLGYLLRFGQYNQLDVLRLFHRVLHPWAPRRLIVPNMHYPPGAVIGLQALVPGQSARGMMLAGDNAFAHQAATTLGNMRHHHRGILNFGPAHVPEIRPIIEAFFRRLEEGALRAIAGGFQPATLIGEGPTPTTFLRAEDHPLHLEGFHDLIDVILAGHNVTPHSGLQQRLPADFLRTHLQGGGWCFETADATGDAERLTTIRIHPTVRGGREGGKLPHIQWEHAIYRSTRLENDRSQVGVRQQADVNIEDARTMILLDPVNGGPWSKLHALPPYDATAHDVFLRKKIQSARERGLLKIAGSDDAIAAYDEMVHTMAYRDGVGVDKYVQNSSVRGTDPKPRQSMPLQDFAPRAGRFSFGNGRDRT